MKYFDFAATTPPDNDILKTMIEVEEKFFRKPDSSLTSRKFKESIKSEILSTLNFPNDFEIILTSSGTEANNLGMLGKFTHKAEKKHIITSSFEHPSILECCKELKRLGHEVTYIEPNLHGFIEPNDILQEVKPNTGLISIMQVNNELGTIQNINEIFKNIKEKYPEITTMTDSIQALGKTSLPTKYCDMLTLSSHKIYGPRGVGALIKQKNIALNPLLFAAEKNLSPGTHSLGAQLGFLKALKNMINNFEDNSLKTETLKKYFLEKITKNSKIKINGSLDLHKTVNILNLTLETAALSSTIVEYFEDNDIIVSTRSSCSARSASLSHVLKSIGLPDNKIERTIRISFDHHTTKGDIDYLYSKLEDVLQNF